MCHLHRTHYPICRSTITTSITLCSNARHREQRHLEGFAETDIWCTKRTSEYSVNRFEVCWKCGGGPAPPRRAAGRDDVTREDHRAMRRPPQAQGDANLRLAGRVNSQRAEKRGRVYGKTERRETDDGFWDSDAETLHGDATPPLRKEFALATPPHLRGKDVASMQRARAATEELRGITMGSTRMPGTPSKVAIPERDIIKIPRTPLRAPTVGRFHHMALAKGEAAERVILQNQVAVSPCRQGALIASLMEQRIILSRAQTSLRRQRTILERGDDKREEIRGRARRRIGTMTAPKTPTLFTPPSTPKLPQTARFEGPALEQIKEWQEEDEKDKTKATVKLQQTEQKKDVARMQKNAERMQKNTEGTKENQKTAIKIGCPSLGYTKVMVENGDEEKELTMGQRFERRREALRILEGKQDVAVVEEMGPVCRSRWFLDRGLLLQSYCRTKAY